MGTIAKGKVGKRTIELTNVGFNALKIRKVMANGKELRASANKTEIKNGKSAQLKIEVLPAEDLKPGNYSRQIVLITNDPAKPRMNVVVNWTIAE